MHRYINPPGTPNLDGCFLKDDRKITNGNGNGVLDDNVDNSTSDDDKRGLRDNFSSPIPGTLQHDEGSSQDYGNHNNVLNNDEESAQEDNDDEDEVQDQQQEEQPEVEEQATGLSMPKENNFLSSFPNTTGLSDEFVAAHRNSLNNRSDDSSTRETITEGADEIGKLAAAAVNDYDLGGLTGFKL